MHTHDIDLASLVWGVILTVATVLLGLAVWTDITINLGVLLPAALICSGAVLLVVVLVRAARAGRR